MVLLLPDRCLRFDATNRYNEVVAAPGASLWHYAMIEDVVNVLAWGPWAETSYQLRWNIFGQTEGLDPSEEGVESDNHPASLELSNRL
jgi:hypothetical protein